jgi:hypothetical protein
MKIDEDDDKESYYFLISMPPSWRGERGIEAEGLNYDAIIVLGSEGGEYMLYWNSNEYKALDVYVEYP